MRKSVKFLPSYSQIESKISLSNISPMDLLPPMPTQTIVDPMISLPITNEEDAFLFIGIFDVLQQNVLVA